MTRRKLIVDGENIDQPSTDHSQNMYVIKNASNHPLSCLSEDEISELFDFDKDVPIKREL